MEKNDIVKASNADLQFHVISLREIAMALDTIRQSNAYLFSIPESEAAPRPIGRKGLDKLIDTMMAEDAPSDKVNADVFLDHLRQRVERFR